MATLRCVSLSLVRFSFVKLITLRYVHVNLGHVQVLFCCNKLHTFSNQCHVPTFLNVEPLIPQIQYLFVASILTRMKCYIHS